MLLSHHQKAWKYRDVKIGNRSFENMVQFKYLRTTIANQILFWRKLRGD
jgi:hypothetical protein